MMGRVPKLEMTTDGWIVRVPDEAVAHLGLSDGDAVVLRAMPHSKDVVRDAIAQLRGRAREYPQDFTDDRP
jgi:hypothetical protein